uniref:CRAL-TRIO domain-containing protein C3H8.02 n=1 Tax=Lygus hesperus TaxID=30085 RepID=A0A0A9YT75_LYGHE
MIWSAIKNFIDKRTACKVIMLTHLTDILKYIDKDNCIVEFGGYVQNAFDLEYFLGYRETPEKGYSIERRYINPVPCYSNSSSSSDSSSTSEHGRSSRNVHASSSGGTQEQGVSEMTRLLANIPMLQVSPDHWRLKRSIAFSGLVQHEHSTNCTW